MGLIEDRVAIVTGATGTGIGQGIALGLAEEGANIVVCGRHPERGVKLIDEIKKLGRRTLLLKTDVSIYDQVKEMVQTVLKEFGKVDILINNAAISLPAPVMEMSNTTWQRVIDICLNGVFYCSKEVLGPMVRQGYGKIVNITSYVGYSGFENMAHYSAAKAGVITFTKSLAMEVAKYKINVNAIAPGFIYHERMNNVISKEEIEGLIKKIPLGRVGEPKDIVGATLLLVSDWGSYITGETICVTGGLYMP